MHELGQRPRAVADGGVGSFFGGERGAQLAAVVVKLALQSVAISRQPQIEILHDARALHLDLRLVLGETRGVHVDDLLLAILLALEIALALLRRLSVPRVFGQLGLA